MKRALLSVSNKTGLVDFATRLIAAGYEILSTGGTQKALQEAGIAVTGVEEVTAFPECFSGRVKTMHPLILGGVLFRRDDADHQSQAQELGIGPIDVVVVNLYPFEEALAAGKSGAELIEQIDIGGPTLLRSAAKNHSDVTVICQIEDYERVIGEIEETGDTTPETRAYLAAKVFERTTSYDAAIAGALSQESTKGITLHNGLSLRYGENPHQIGTYYDIYGHKCPWSVLQEQKQMSYLNLLDADAAWQLVEEFKRPTAACIKHANPSGVASADSIEEAFQRSYDADRLSAFGVIVSLNRPCTKNMIKKMIDQKIFAELIIAPSFDDDALELLTKKPKIRAIAVDRSGLKLEERSQLRSVLGGIIEQNFDTRKITADDLTCVTDTAPSSDQIQDLLFAWSVVKYAKSNAIVFAKTATTLGIGCGQTSRVDSTWIAAKRAGNLPTDVFGESPLTGAVMASDAFFPFPDSVEEAARHGVEAIIQPGGSIRDEEVIAKANELGIAMVVTGIRVFRH